MLHLVPFGGKCNGIFYKAGFAVSQLLQIRFRQARGQRFQTIRIYGPKLKCFTGTRSKIQIHRKYALFILRVNGQLCSRKPGYHFLTFELLHSLRRNTAVFIGYGIISHVHILHVLAGVQQAAEALQGNENGDAHDNGQNGDHRAAGVPPEIEPCVKCFEVPNLFLLPAAPPDLYSLPTHGCCRRHTGSVPGGWECGQYCKKQRDKDTQEHGQGTAGPAACDHII